MLHPKKNTHRTMYTCIYIIFNIHTIMLTANRKLLIDMKERSSNSTMK